jgi:hypothetical protein
MEDQLTESYDGEIEGNLVEFFPAASCTYGNGRLEAGEIKGLGEDDMYIKIARDGKEDVIAMRDDEAMAIVATISLTVQTRMKRAFEASLDA